MAVAVADSVAVSQVAASSITFTLPNGKPNVGDLLLAELWVSQTSPTPGATVGNPMDITVPSGWTRVVPLNVSNYNSGSNNGVAALGATVIAKYATSADAAGTGAFTFTDSGTAPIANFGGGALYRITGSDTVNLIAGFATGVVQAMTSAGAIACPAYTPAEAGTLLISGFVGLGTGSVDNPAASGSWTRAAFAEKSNGYNETATATYLNPPLASQQLTLTTTVAVSYAVTFTIAIQPPATGSPVSTSPTSVTVNVGTTVAAAATQSGNSSFTAASQNPAIATVAVSGSTISITGVAAGTTSVVVTGAAGNTATISVTCLGPVPAGTAELLPAAFASNAAPGFTSSTATAGSAANLHTDGVWTSFFSSALPGFVEADLGVAAPISGILVAPRQFDNAGLALANYREYNVGGAVLLGGSVALTSPTDSNGTNLLTIPAGSTLRNFRLNSFSVTTSGSFRFVLFGCASNANGSFDLAELRILGSYVAGVLYRPLTPTIATTRTTNEVVATLTSPTTNASIVYTIDGSEPAISATTGSVTNGTLIANGGTATISTENASNGVGTIRAIAVLGLLSSSDTLVAQFNLPQMLALGAQQYDTTGRPMTGLGGGLYADFGTGFSNRYWMVATDFNGPANQNTHTPPYGIIAYSSPDLLTWRPEPAACVYPPFQSGSGEYPYDRPHIFKNPSDGFYYMWCDVLSQAGGSGGATNPTTATQVFKTSALGSAWTYVGTPFQPNPGFAPGDSNVFVDPVTGQPYYVTVNTQLTPTNVYSINIMLFPINANGSSVGAGQVIDSNGSVAREAVGMFYRGGRYYFYASTVDPYTGGADWFWKSATSIAGLIAQATSPGTKPFSAATGFPAGSSVGTPFCAQPNDVVPIEGVVDQFGQQALLFWGQTWNSSSLPSSASIFLPLRFDASGNLSILASDSAWTPAPTFGESIGGVAAGGSHLFYRL